ncbi:MAG: hypothetical protein SGPRY_011582, partial [Prymnesium sp.]
MISNDEGPASDRHKPGARMAALTPFSPAAEASPAAGSQASAEEGEADAWDKFELFSTRRPRDVFAGTSSGLKSLTKGVFGGISSLVVAPVMGAQNNGLPGFCQGLAQGLIGAIALPVAGAAVATLQVGRGIVNTPEAWAEQAKGKDWDNESRSWRANYGIERCHQKVALKLHPDKNPNNEEAKEKFQKLSQAYQVLADEQTRAKYDQHGTKVVDGQGFLDAGVFFTMLFGSERFEPYIGTLALASAASMEGQLSMHRMQVRQVKREVDLALRLVRLIEPLMVEDGDKDKIQADLKKEASCMLPLPAFTAEFAGVKSFLQVESHIASLNSKWLSIQNHTAAAGAGIKAAGAAIRTFKTVKELADQQQADGGSTSDPMANMTPKQLKSTQESLPAFLEAMWHVSVLDIEKTLTNVTYKVFKDHSVPEDVRLRRAHAVLMVGKIFMEAAVASGGSKNPQKKVAEMIAMLTPSASTAGAASGSENDKDVRSDRRKEEAADATPQAGATMDQGQKLSKLSLEELRGMSVRQLKGVLVARQVDCVDMVEKEDLVQECLSQPAPIHATFRL